MKQWFVVDDAITARGEVFERPLNTQDKEKALRAALGDWNYLTNSEKKNRDDFYIAFAEADSDGHIDFDTVTETVDIKNKADT